MIWNANRSGHFNGKEIVTYLHYSQGIGSPQIQEASHHPKQAPQPQSPNDLEGFRLVTHANKVKAAPSSLRAGVVASKTALNNSPSPTKAIQPAQPLKKPAAITDGIRKSHQMLMSRVRGHFLFLCERCFDGAPPFMCSMSTVGPYCHNDDAKHPWEKSKVLVSIITIGGRYRYQKVRLRPKGIPARSLPCWNISKRYGCRVGNPCKFAHNEVQIPRIRYKDFYKLYCLVVVIHRCDQMS